MSKDHFMLRRRDLLALAPACAVTAGLTSSPAAASCLFGHGGEKLSLAYWSGSDALPSLERLSELTELEDQEQDALAQGELIPAEWLERGDSRFNESDVRLRVHGLFAADGRAVQDLAPLEIEAHFTPFHDATTQLWQFQAGAQPCPCSATGLTLPVTAEHGLSLSFRIDGQTDGAATRFTLGGEGGLPKLRRGVYLAAWRGESAASLPSWHRFQVMSRAPRDDEEPLLAPHRLRLAHRHGSSLPLDQPYLVLSFDHAA